MRAPWIVLAALVTACSGDDGPAPPDAAVPPTVYIVRHAETGSTATDPSLNTTGQARAQALATRLAQANITAVYASQYLRTRETAQPTADAAGVTVTVSMVTGSNAATYGAELAAAVRNTMATSTLIVGHSNTVPDTVKAFTGVTVPAIAETEYDRIYTVTLAADGAQLDAATY
jgi:phosphohistidine phosphatase SixA